MEARGSSEASSVVLILTRVLVNYLAAVWGEKKVGGKGVKIQETHCFPRACIADFSPLSKILCFQLLSTHPSLFPFSPLEELPQPWWSTAAAVSGGSDGRG